MKINHKVGVLFLSVFLFLISKEMIAQVILEPSEVHTTTLNYLDFSPGFWAEKGEVFSAKHPRSIIKAIDESNNETVDSDSKYNEYVSVEQEDTISPVGDFRIFPNPFDDQISIKIGTHQDSPLRIDLYNVHGQLVKKVINIKSNSGGLQTYTVNVSDVNQGLYFITARADNFFSSRKVIK